MQIGHRYLDPNVLFFVGEKADTMANLAEAINQCPRQIPFSDYISSELNTGGPSIQVFENFRDYAIATVPRLNPSLVNTNRSILGNRSARQGIRIDRACG